MKRFYVVSLFLSIAAAACATSYAQGMMGSGSGSFPGYEGHEMDHNLVLPQIAIGDSYTTTLVLMNLGNSTQMGWVPTDQLQTTGKIYFYKQDGTRLAVSINGASPASEFAFSLDPAKTGYYELMGKGADVPGWALIAVDDQGANWGSMDGQNMMRGMRIMATVFYTYKDGSQPASRVGVLPSMYEMGLFHSSLMSVQSRDDLYTGVAIVNTNSRPVSINLLLKDTGGQTIATRQLTLPAGNQIARFTNEIFASGMPAGFQGLLEIDTNDEGIVTMGLLVSQGILTSIPTMHYGQVTSTMMR